MCQTQKRRPIVLTIAGMTSHKTNGTVLINGSASEIYNNRHVADINGRRKNTVAAIAHHLAATWFVLAEFCSNSLTIQQPISEKATVLSTSNIS